MPADRRSRAVVAVVAALVALGLLLQLTHRTERLSGSDDASPQAFSVFTEGPGQVCQGSTSLFPDTAALRMTIGTYGAPGPELRTTVSAGDAVLARGTLPAGWREGIVDLPLAPVSKEQVGGVTVCVTAERGGRLAFGGEPAPPEVAATVDGTASGGRIAIASLLPERASLLGSAGRIAERYGRGNAEWLGGWTFALMGLLLVGAVAAAVAALRAPPGARTWRLPRAAVLCAACSLATSSTWALLTPPFHVPDEVSHVAYVQTVVEVGELPVPRPGVPAFSEQQNRLLASLQFFDVIGASVAKPPWTAVEEEPVRVAEASPSSRKTTNAASASNNPPLYYLLQAPVYAATRGGSLLEQQLPMRLVSVLLGALTVLFAFGFVREVLPGTPLAWPLGALMVALQPLFGFITSGVNGDALVFTAGAATFFLMARLLRRGLTTRRAVGLGAAVAAGLLAKPLFLGLLPAALLALVIAAVRGRTTLGGRRARTIAATGLVVLFAPILAYHLVATAAFDHGYLTSGVPGTTGPAQGAPPPPTDTSLKANVGYVWQLFAPRLPIMNDRWEGVPLRNVWFNGFVGRFGWLDYGFPEWVSASALVVVGLLVLLLVAGLVRERAGVRRQLGLLACCVVALGGIVAVIGYAQLQAMIDGQPAFTQARYLLPLLALYALLTALVARAAGRRAMPLVAIALVGLAVFHEVSSLILTIGRYYA